jgi:pimeloyl-ACP methyl ester carboxylesterase
LSELVETTVRMRDGRCLYVQRRPAAGTAQYALLLIHGWPGSADDWSAVLRSLQGTELDAVEVLVPELRGFGRSAMAATDQPAGPPIHLSDLRTVLDHHAARDVVVGGYDLGATLAQGLARNSNVRGLLLGCPPYPGIGTRRFEPQVQAELWYQQLHQQPWAQTLIGQDRRTLELYLRHWYTHWWGTGAVTESHFQALVDLYELPGAFQGSIDWYRARAASRSREAAAPPPPIKLPTEVLWGAEDPVNPARFADRLGDFFPDFALRVLPGVGHFIPLEAPGHVVTALQRLHGRLRIARRDATRRGAAPDVTG